MSPHDRPKGLGGMADCPPTMGAPLDPRDADADAALMAAFARGDARAFDQLYARHQAALYRFVRRLLGTALAAQADEVFQDTWLRVVQARERFVADPRTRACAAASDAADAADAAALRSATFRTWLFTLAHHRAIDQLRKSGREVSTAAFEGDDDEPFVPTGEPWLDWPAPGSAGPDEQMFWRRAGERLLGCLDQLPPPQRVVFLMHHDEDCTVDDIARALELGFETAKSRLRYAMSKLRTCMGAYLSPEVLGGRS